MLNFLKRVIQKIEFNYAETTSVREDRPVLEYLKRNYGTHSFSCLEVGSGEGRFASLLKKEFPEINLLCLEINEQLSEKTRQQGLQTVSSDILRLELPGESFDVIHASHIIEHFDYPAIAQLLDKLIGLLKPGGHLIIRSPLLYPGFFDDLDHIRPYPPSAIMNYFSNNQQQRAGRGRVASELVWYRRVAVTTRYRVSRFYTVLNAASMLLWICVGFPRSKVTGYVAIFRKK